MQFIYADFVSFVVLLTACGFVLICQDFPFSLLVFFSKILCISRIWGVDLFAKWGLDGLCIKGDFHFFILLVGFL